jgi:hypothetical protein
VVDRHSCSWRNRRENCVSFGRAKNTWLAPPTSADSNAWKIRGTCLIIKLIEVRQKKDAPDSRCSWEPPDDKLWRRVLCCDWMAAEGWILKTEAYTQSEEPALQGR